MSGDSLPTQFGTMHASGPFVPPNRDRKSRRTNLTGAADVPRPTHGTSGWSTSRTDLLRSRAPKGTASADTGAIQGRLPMPPGRDRWRGARIANAWKEASKSSLPTRGRGNALQRRIRRAIRERSGTLRLLCRERWKQSRHSRENSLLNVLTLPPMRQLAKAALAHQRSGEYGLQTAMEQSRSTG